MSLKSAVNPHVAGATSSRLGGRSASIELFLVSFMILFLELACIRWLGSTVVFLTFFTNIVLMACFLGVSVGCLAAERKWSWINAFIPLAIVMAGSACGVFWAYNNFDQVMIDVGSQQSPQLIYFGTDTAKQRPDKMGRADRVFGGLFLRCGRAFIRWPGPGDG